MKLSYYGWLVVFLAQISHLKGIGLNKKKIKKYVLNMKWSFEVLNCERVVGFSTHWPSFMRFEFIISFNKIESKGHKSNSSLILPEGLVWYNGFEEEMKKVIPNLGTERGLIMKKIYSLQSPKKMKLKERSFLLILTIFSRK